MSKPEQNKLTTTISIDRIRVVLHCGYCATELEAIPKIADGKLLVEPCRNCWEERWSEGYDEGERAGRNR